MNIEYRLHNKKAFIHECYTRHLLELGDQQTFIQAHRHLLQSQKKSVQIQNQNPIEQPISHSKFMIGFVLQVIIFTLEIFDKNTIESMTLASLQKMDKGFWICLQTQELQMTSTLPSTIMNGDVYKLNAYPFIQKRFPEILHLSNLSSEKMDCVLNRFKYTFIEMLNGECMTFLIHSKDNTECIIDWKYN